jgi:molybdenum cofactor cytidylyltransferase
VGMFTSAAAAAHAVTQEADALVILLADMPLVAATMLETMVAEYLKSGSRLVVSRYGDIIAPPTLFDRALFPHLQSMEGGNVKELVERFWSDATVVDWQPALLQDIDTPSDFEALSAGGE